MKKKDKRNPIKPFEIGLPEGREEPKKESKMKAVDEESLENMGKLADELRIDDELDLDEDIILDEEETEVPVTTEE